MIFQNLNLLDLKTQDDFYRLEEQRKKSYRKV